MRMWGQRSNHSGQTHVDSRLLLSLASGTLSFSSSPHSLFLALSWRSRFHLFMTADTVCVQAGTVPPVAMAAGKHKLTSLSHAGVRNSSQTERITFFAHARAHAHTQMYNYLHKQNHPST